MNSRLVIGVTGAAALAVFFRFWNHRFPIPGTGSPQVKHAASALAIIPLQALHRVMLY
jgi:hypothetical protein